MTKSLSSFVKQQFPTYLLEGNSLLPEFLEAYYEWASSGNNFQKVTYDIGNIGNIDESFDKFRDEFIAEYLDGIPEDVVADKSILIKKISELYKAKGTPKAVSFLIKILYNLDSQIYFPSTQIFKPSAAKWNRDVSIRFRLDSGVLTDFGNFVISIVTTENKAYDLEVKSISRVIDASNVFEAILDLNFKLEIPTGGKVSTDSFTGTLVRSATKKKIIDAGMGFDVGEIYQVTNGLSTPQLIKVTKINKNRGLAGFDIIQYGNGFNSNFFATISPDMLVTNQEPNLLISTPSTDLGVSSNDGINRAEERMLITKHDYTDSTYFEDNTYVGEVKGEVRVDTVAFKNSNVDINAAVVFFELGYILTYPGYYSDNVGFLDDASYIQDGRYYQQYSYVTKAEVEFEKYKNIVKQLVHPAGLQMFGEYTISNDVDIIVDIVNQLNILKQGFEDIIRASDDIDVKIVIKSLEEFVDLVEITRLTLTKPLTDEATVLDVPAKTFTRRVSETQSVTDAKVLTFSKALTETISTVEQTIKDISKVYNDNVSSTELVAKSLTKPNLADTFSALDSMAKTLNKIFAETISTSDANTKTVGKNLVHNVTGTDSNTKSFAKELQETVTTPETINKTNSKVFSDIVSVAESIIVFITTIRNFVDSVISTDEKVLSVGKVASDSLNITESISKNNDKIASDSINSTNSGYIFGTDYIEFSDYLSSGLYWEFGYIDTEIPISN